MFCFHFALCFWHPCLNSKTKNRMCVCTQKISSPLKEGEEISLNGHASVQVALHGFMLLFFLHI